MAKIRLQKSLIGHRKLFRLAATLKISRVQALGHLAFLWSWAVTNAEDGDLSAIDRRIIAEAADWGGRPEHLWDALTRAGFIADGRLHDWPYGIERAKARAVARERHLVRRLRIIRRDGMICGICRRAIERMDDLHIDHIVPRSRGGSSDPSNLQPAHALCNMKKGAR